LAPSPARRGSWQFTVDKLYFVTVVTPGACFLREAEGVPVRV
jgi:hypothetical protein